MDINQEIKMRISKTEELLSQVKDKTTLAYLLGLHGVKSDYEAIGDLENAYKYATLIIDLLSAKKNSGNFEEQSYNMHKEFIELMQQNINFLIMDEPTNHIDITTREVLESALSEFQGTILFISTSFLGFI